MTKLDLLHQHGQSIWYDFIRRDMLDGGGLADLVSDGIRGVTSNPSIFESAIAKTELYDEQIASLGDVSPESAFEALAIDDIRAAADILASVYDDSDGEDGYVSLEVSPRLANDTAGTISDAMRLWDAVDRRNLMVKVPATPAGIPAIEELTAAGININATLMFSMADYEGVAMAFVRGARRASDPAVLASVASFFVSRVDASTDAALERVGTDQAASYLGKAAIANAKLAYRRFQEIFEGDDFATLEAIGCRPQRVLWASTSTKNPAYNDVMYVEELIGPRTVNTAPPHTIEAFLDHGEVKGGSLLKGVNEAATLIRDLPTIGVDFDAITHQLQIDGVASFAKAYESLLTAIATKQRRVVA
ncbi:MAG: transaldolase [Armatimonadetes bacterium]|nr:MAG: transaldolase [Armatimonadota bacterium]